MKFILIIMATILTATSCSSPSEKYDDQRMEAKKEYKHSMRQAQDEYQDGEAELRKDRAKTMVDESDDVDVDLDEGKIDVE